MFELRDAVLCSPSPVGSVPSLSLEPVFRRGHGSLYTAPARGDIDTDKLRRLLTANLAADWPLVFAVDASTGIVAMPRPAPSAGSTTRHRSIRRVNQSWLVGTTSGSASSASNRIRGGC